MGTTAERIGTPRIWLTTATAGIFVLVAGIIAFPRVVYTNFIWKYFWGPIDADAHNAVCAVRAGSTVRRFDTASVCQTALSRGFAVAEPGYTFVSEVGYAIVLLFILAGLLILIRRLGIGTDRTVLFALVPFVLFGGALRTVEDAANVVPVGIGYPTNTLIISPVIYVTVFIITLSAILVSLWLSQRGIVEGYEPVLAGFGTLALFITVGYLGFLVTTTRALQFHPQMLILTLGIASLIAGGVYLAIGKTMPSLNAGTGLIGLTILWAQSVDGVSNVLASDWWNVIGLPFQYSAKHPVNRIIVGITELVVPSSVISTIGDSWPFLLVKVILAVGVIWLFDESIFEESPRYSYLLMLAIIVVGLGPGTRDMLRATFGI